MLGEYVLRVILPAMYDYRAQSEYHSCGLKLDVRVVVQGTLDVRI